MWFVTLLRVITNAGTFFLFAALTIVALVYFAMRVPETKGRQLGDVEQRGTAAKVRAA